jgi:uridine phosphorylase
MSQFPETELILTKDHRVYHINLKAEDIADDVIVVGDQHRVAQISKFFSKIEFKTQHREFVTHTGYIGKKRLSVTSTGIGPDNIDIVLNELDALVNIDFNTRTIKEKLTALNIIRVGTCGSLQASIPVDSYVASTHGLGLDNLMNFYQHNSNEEEKQLLQSFNNHTQLHQGITAPYITGAGMSLLKEFVIGFHQGITVTCPGFYGPQGRVLRMGLTQPLLIDRLTSFTFGQHRISNFEMETSAIYGMGKVLGHHCLSLSAVVANRINKEFSKDGAKAVEGLIEKTLEIVSTSVR